MLDKIEQEWETHCRAQADPRHLPFSEGGNARYDSNFARTYIECLYPKCKWHYELPSRHSDV